MDFDKNYVKEECDFFLTELTSKILSKNIHNITKIQKLFPHEIWAAATTRCQNVFYVYICVDEFHWLKGIRKRDNSLAHLLPLCSHIFIFWGVGGK